MEVWCGGIVDDLIGRELVLGLLGFGFGGVGSWHWVDGGRFA